MAIKLSSKDKSLLLFAAAGFVVLWFVFSFLTNLVFSSAFVELDSSKIISSYKNEEDRWLNLSRNLENKDLKNRVILLDFWTHACVNCLHTIPEIKKLEQEFGSKLVVIGVHSGKFANEKDVESIKKAVLKYDINHPVVNDSDLKIWNAFGVDAWPSFVLIDPRGRVKKTYVGEGDVRHIKKDVKKMVEKYRYHLNREELPVLPEKNKIIKTVLSYPTKIIYARDFSYKSYKGQALFIANSGRNNILVSTISGEVIVQIGAKDAGFSDGSIDTAKFNIPTGLLYQNGKLYIADSGNHALREVDFKTSKVITLIGEQKRGGVISGENIKLENVNLASPSDLEFFPDKNHIAISNSGTHQILSYNLLEKKVSVLAGNGSEGISDGNYPRNSLAQTSDLSVFDGKLYFLDSETSSLRVMNKNGEVKTLLGTGLFDFGHKNGDKKEALMQHPLGLFVNKNGAYISDSFNHKIRKYEFSSGKIKDLFGSQRGEDLGSETKFDEPDGLVVVDESLFVCDTNNNRIVKLDFKKMNSSLLNVMPPLQLPKDGFLQYLPNLQKSDSTKVKSQNVAIKINFESDWKINESGPSFINLLELVGEKDANLITTFDWNMIKNDDMNLPKLDTNKKYILQGTIYYCQDKKNSLCYINSYEQEIEVDSDGKQIINIEL